MKEKFEIVRNKERSKTFKDDVEPKSSEQILAEMEAKGLRPATFKEVMEFGGFELDPAIAEDINKAIQVNGDYLKTVEENLESFKKIKKVIEDSKENPDQATELKSTELLIAEFEYIKRKLQHSIDYDKAFYKLLTGESDSKEK